MTDSDSKNKGKRAHEVAGGIPAILSSLKHSFSEMGVVRSTKLLLSLNQKGGFDCPGCAWPEPDDHRSLAEFCENGAKAIADEATTKRITAEFFSKYSIAELLVQNDFWLGKQGRLTHPMVRMPHSTHYQPLSWDEAFELIGNQLRALSSPDQAAFYTSGRTSNEAAFLYQLFVRIYGTNNLPDCSNMCHESSGTALMETLGVGKGSVTLADFDLADCILIIGQNPGTNHPRMLTSLQNAARRGCQIISINPLPEAGLIRFIHPQEVTHLLGTGTPLTSYFLQVKINGDVALLKGIMKDLLEIETAQPGSVFDKAFITTYCTGFDEFISDLKMTSWDSVIETSGINREQIRDVARIIQKSKNMIICWAMGLTQHRNGVANIQEAVNLLLLGGHLGRPGAGACPVRGHSNVQGDRTMGIFEKMPDSFLDQLEREFHFTAPRKYGFDVVETIKTMLSGQIKVFIGMGGNFLSATPDTEAVTQALQRCDLTVQVSTKLNRSHLVTGKMALILPCLGRTEEDIQKSGPQFVTVENSMGVVHSSRGTLKPASTQLKSEIEIVAKMAQATLNGSKWHHANLNWDDFVDNYDEIRNRISKVIPGFDHFNERVKKPGGFHLPHPVRDSRTFRTATGKAHFTVHPIEPIELEINQYLLMTIRSHDQYNTTIYGLNDRYRGISHERRVLFMNPEDITQAGFKLGMWVDIQSHFSDEIRIASRFRIVPYSIPRRCIATYFPEANVLVPIGHTAEKSNTPAYKSIVVTLKQCN